MKKVALILYILMLVSAPWANAEDPAMTAVTKTHTILGGMVKAVSWVDPAKGMKSEITVIDAPGKKINIYVMPTTTLWDKDAKAIMRDAIVPRSRVNVIYFTTPEGINVGKSIKILN